MRYSVKNVLKIAIGLAAAVTGFTLSPASAAEKKDFKVAWSIYVGWMPWGYAADSGIVKKWATSTASTSKSSSSTTTSSRSTSTQPAPSTQSP